MRFSCHILHLMLMCTLHVPARQCKCLSSPNIMRPYSAVLRVKAGGHVNIQVSIVTQVMGASPQNNMSADVP